MFSLNKFSKFYFTNRWLARYFKRTTFILTLNSSGVYDRNNLLSLKCLVLNVLLLVVTHVKQCTYNFISWVFSYLPFLILPVHMSLMSQICRNCKWKSFIGLLTFNRGQSVIAPRGTLLSILPKPHYSMSQTWGFLRFSLGKLLHGPKDFTILEFSLISCLKFSHYLNYPARYIQASAKKS